MTNDFKLSPEEILHAEQELLGLRHVLTEIERCKQFKVGDYLIGRHMDYNGNIGDTVESVSLKTPEKFVVVYLNTEGIPYYKRVDAKGKAWGPLTCCIVSDRSNITRDVKFTGSKYYMELDPDYADAIILDSKDGFDPSLQRKLKADIYKEITQHNKDNKINTHDVVDLEKYFKTLKAGDIIYRSARTFYTVQHVELLTKKQAEDKYGYEFNSNSALSLNARLNIVHIIDSKGKEKMLSSALWDTQYSNLYKEKPRTYKELQDK